jgi:hypothetical protein
VPLHNHQLVAQHGDLDIFFVGIGPEPQQPEDTPDDQEAHRGTHRQHPRMQTSSLVTARILRLHPTGQLSDPSTS